MPAEFNRRTAFETSAIGVAEATTDIAAVAAVAFIPAPETADAQRISWPIARSSAIWFAVTTATSRRASSAAIASSRSSIDTSRPYSSQSKLALVYCCDALAKFEPGARGFARSLSNWFASILTYFPFDVPVGTTGRMRWPAKA